MVKRAISITASAVRKSWRSSLAAFSGRAWLKAAVVFAFALGAVLPFAAFAGEETSFRREIQPLLKEFCYDCHADGANKGNIAFDEFKSDQAVLENHDLWLKALKNIRAGL